MLIVLIHIIYYSLLQLQGLYTMTVCMIELVFFFFTNWNMWLTWSFLVICAYLSWFYLVKNKKHATEAPGLLYIYLCPLVLTFYSTRLARQKFYLEKNLSSESSRVKFKNGIHSTRSSFHGFVSSEFRVLVEYFWRTIVIFCIYRKCFPY